MNITWHAPGFNSEINEFRQTQEVRYQIDGLLKDFSIHHKSLCFKFSEAAIVTMIHCNMVGVICDAANTVIAAASVAQDYTTGKLSLCLDDVIIHSANYYAICSSKESLTNFVKSILDSLRNHAVIINETSNTKYELITINTAYKGRLYEILKDVEDINPETTIYGLRV